MPKDALPCIVCGTQLSNVTEDSENQPSGGTAFDTQGHYGSTAFDPMDGTYLEITLCDPCLRTAAKNHQVLWNTRYLNITCDGVLVGRQWVHRGMVPWNPDVEEHETPDDQLYVDVDEIGSDLGRTTEWKGDWRELQALIRRAREEE